MKKRLLSVTLILALFILPCKSSAESSLDVVLWDSLVGAGIGALAGAATLAFMDHPGDHLRRVAQGASIGLLFGAAFGIYEIKPMMYSYIEPDGKRERVYGLLVNVPLK
jgi:hypothetical protein